MEFRKRIIDVFINSVYLYDEKVVIFYNIKEGKQISYIEMIESLDEKDENNENAENDLSENPLNTRVLECSDIKVSSPPKVPYSNHD